MRLPTLLLRRKPNAYKGDFGHIFILSGSERFSGAAVLCSEAAMRSGAGLVTLGIPKSLNRAIIKIKPKEVMTFPLPETSDGTLSLSGYKKIKDFVKSIDVLVVGPGLSQNKSTQGLVRKVVSKIGKPMVVDADGLNALVGHLKMLSAVSCQLSAKILTPHSGEMARLMGMSIKRVQADRKGIAKKFAEDYKVTVVLKGDNTVVADYNGNLYINKTGNPGMATAGSGDVLAGMIAALLGQGLSKFEASKYAVYLHGLAGDLAAKEKTQMGMIASDIIDKIPEAIKRCS
ncbi:MAG: NAD(P)H-hydrate dehydratase [Candidatus Omnitrophota bacterium]|nr:NAD(P)H-hydrate dehydratase [Candidatus Omnitrophota bacterium]